MKQKNDTILIISILIPISTGVLSAFFSGDMSVYSRLCKPAFSPPAILFPLVWIILYALMGLSSYIVYLSDSPHKKKALQDYLLQLLFNFFWSIIFFGFSLYFIAFIWLLALLVLVAAMIWQFYMVGPPAAYLQLPYLVWCLYSAYLNFCMFRLN